MRGLVKDLVQHTLTRRGFLTKMAAAGYTATAARSALASVSPFVQGARGEEALTRVMTGTGGELLAEQLIEAGARYMFVSNGSGLGPLCDALVTRPPIQLIQATHEGQVVAIADGYAKASGAIGFAMYSRVGLPHSSSNMYNAMKDRTSIVLISDHAETNREGTDSHEDIDDWLEPVKQYTKWRWVVHQPERIPEWVRQACKVSSVMPGGPTYIRIPRDLLYRDNLTANIFKGEAFRIPMEIRPDPTEVERAARVLWAAASPLLYVGPEVSQSAARADVVKLAELLGVPVVQHRSFYADFPTSHPLHVGEYADTMRFPEKVDCLINFGARAPVRVPSGTSMINASVDPMVLGRNTPMRAALLGDLGQVARDLVEAIKSLAPAAALRERGQTRLAAAKAYTSRVRETRLLLARRAGGTPVPWQRLVVELRSREDLSEYLPPGAAKPLVAKHCATCHDLRGLIELRKPRDAWDALVLDMVARGAPLMLDEVDPLIGYLSDAFGPNAPPLVDVNTASKDELIKLPGISPPLAERLIAHRTANGPLASRDQVRTVLGLEEGAFEKIKWYVRTGGAAAEK